MDAPRLAADLLRSCKCATREDRKIEAAAIAHRVSSKVLPDRPPYSAAILPLALPMHGEVV
jgi:hypothetical protein